MAWLTRFGNLFRSRRLAREIDEELHFHLAMREEALVREGLLPEEARRQARLAVGNPIALRERTREADVPVLIEAFVQDARLALRGLARNPGFTTAAVLTLALGIGTTTAMLSIVDAVVLRPLPYPQPERLYGLFQLHDDLEVGRTRAAPLDFLDWQARSTSFQALAAHTGTGFTFTGGGEPELVLGQLASAELFDVLGVSPALGRTFWPEENEAGRDRVVILSDGLWRRRFSADPAVLGRTVTINGKPCQIVGVMPPGFAYPDKVYQLWAPFPFRGINDQNLPINRQSRYLLVVGRLADGMTAEQANQDLERVTAALKKQLPDSHAYRGIALSSLTEEFVGGVRRSLLLLLGAVAFLLLLACANVTSLQLTRASARQAEMSVRAALGGGRGRLVRQLVTESLVLYGLGSAAGLLLAQATLAGLQALGPRDIPRLDQAAIDLRVLTLASLLVLSVAVLFSLLPALRTARGAGAAGAGLGGHLVTAVAGTQRLRSLILVAEVALSLVLLTGAGLAARSFSRLSAVDLGFHPRQAVTFDVVMQSGRFPDAVAMQAFYREALERLGAQGPVEAVGLTTHLPLSGQDLENSFTIDGYVPPPGSPEPVAGLRGISPGYLAALGIPLLRGRDFTAADHGSEPGVALVNETFARRFWPGQDPLGKQLSPGGDEKKFTVVGVVSDVRHRRPEDVARPEVLLPYVQLDPDFLTAWARGVTLVVRSSADLKLVAELARRELTAIDPDLPAIRLRPVAGLVAEAMAQPRFRTLLLSTFAALALALALVGIFGVTSYFVAQRRQEIGIRLALGARPSDVTSLVIRRGARLTALGILLGSIGAYFLTRAMTSLLFEVSPSDPTTFAGAAALLALTALFAAYLPASRAAATQPVTALRRE